MLNIFLFHNNKIRDLMNPFASTISIEPSLYIYFRWWLRASRNTFDWIQHKHKQNDPMDCNRREIPFHRSSLNSTFGKIERVFTVQKYKNITSFRFPSASVDQPAFNSTKIYESWTENEFKTSHKLMTNNEDKRFEGE